MACRVLQPQGTHSIHLNPPCQTNLNTNPPNSKIDNPAKKAR